MVWHLAPLYFTLLKKFQVQACAGDENNNIDTCRSLSVVAAVWENFAGNIPAKKSDFLCIFQEIRSNEKAKAAVI